MRILTLLLLPACTPWATSTTSADSIELRRGDGNADVDEGQERGNPGGSNGTIKIDRVPFDGHPNNEPHVSCVFEVDMYGFDEGDTAELRFYEWAPTANGELIYTVSSEGDGDDLGEDGAGGGIDIDDQNLIDLGPHLIGTPLQFHGHHVRLEATITSLDGRAYNKIKTFWTSACDEPDDDTGSDTGDTGGDTGDTGPFDENGLPIPIPD